MVADVRERADEDRDPPPCLSTTRRPRARRRTRTPAAVDMLALTLVGVLAGAGSVLDGLSPRVRVDPLVTLVAGGVAVGADVAVPQSAWRLSAAAFVVEVPRFLLPLVVDAPSSLRITEHCLQLGAFVFVDGDSDDGGVFLGPELYGYRLGYVDEARPRRADEAWE